MPKLSRVLAAHLLFFMSYAAGAIAQTVAIEVGSTAVPKRAQAWFKQEIRSFQQAHPEITVESYDIGDNYRPLTLLQDLPRIAENVVGIQTMFERELDDLINADAIIPLQHFLPDPSFEPDGYFPNAFLPVQRQDKTWGVPWLLDAVWLICDWRLFEEAGITQAPRTWDELAKTMELLTRDTNGDNSIDQWGLWVPEHYWVEEILWLSMDRQKNVVYDPKSPNILDNPTTRENISKVRDLVNSDFAKRSAQPLFGAPSPEGQCAMLIAHNFLQYMENTDRIARNILQNKNLRAFPLPSFGEPATIMGQRYYLAIRKSSPEKERASWEFIKWMSRSDISLPLFWFGNPCRKDIPTREDYNAWQNAFLGGMDHIIGSMAHSRPMNIQFRRAAYGILPKQLERFYEGDATLDEVLPVLGHLQKDWVCPEIPQADADALFLK